MFNILRTPRLRFKVCKYRRFKDISLNIKSFLIGGGVTEILTMISVQKCYFQLNRKIEQILMPVVHAN